MVSPGQQQQMQQHHQHHQQQAQQHSQHTNQQNFQQHQQQSIGLHALNQTQQQMDQYNNHLSAAHGHHQTVMHQDYLAVPPQMGSVTTQNYPAQSPNSYGSIPINTVIQHRMSGNHGNLTTHNPLPSPHQRLGPSPSACSVSGNNFYVQGGSNIPHPVSHTPTPTPTPSATPTLQQQMNASVGSGAAGAQGGVVGNVSNAISKLQQLTNGLEMNQPCNTPPGASVNLTPVPSPNHHPHNTMTPPPTSHLINQNRNLATPPSTAQMGPLQYHHKYYAGNLNVTPPIAISQNSGRPARNTASAPAQHMSSGSPSSRVSPNVTISSNLMSPYHSSLNGYRMAAQQPAGSVASYITNSAAAGFINNPGQLQMAGVMNMQTQYQDPTALQRAAAQQNSMYGAYPYIQLNTNPMRPR